MRYLLIVLNIVFISSLYPNKQDSWEIVFYKTYISEYKKMSPDDYKGFSVLVKKSWKKAKSLVPQNSKEDLKLAAKITDQVNFFITITDPSLQEKETEKCINGMKKARGVLAGFASNTYKAKRFVQGFVKEYNKRHA